LFQSLRGGEDVYPGCDDYIADHTNPEIQVLVSMTARCIDGVLDIGSNEFDAAHWVNVKIVNYVLQLK